MRVFLSFALLTCVLAGCDSQPQSGTDAASRIRRPIEIVATTGMVADVVRHVGGDLTEVTQLLGSGIDPHLYKATRDDVQTLMSADLVFYSGLMLEGKMADALVKIANQKPVTAVTENLDESLLLEPEEFAGHYDPHVWMDVKAWAGTSEVVAETLASYDPANAEQYRNNAEQYRQRLQKLHEYGKQVISSIPDERRVLITSHDAFNYLGRAYDIEVLGIQGLSTESEPGLQRVNELVDLIVERQISAVFVESSVSQKNMLALVEGARSRGQDVEIGGELFSDAMGETGTYEGTYEGMIDHNVTMISRALGGAAPAKGLNGKLEFEN